MSAKDICVLSPENIFQAGADSPKKFLSYSDFDGTFYAGDGKDVWPWIDPYERTRYDCSKLDQWKIVFDHMDKLGIMLHVVTQETENELLLDNGYTGVMRKLY